MDSTKKYDFLHKNLVYFKYLLYLCGPICIIMNEFLEKEEKVLQMLKTVYDPEIPVNIYDLGLIYKVDIDEDVCRIDMTLTAPSCPAADFLVEDVRQKVGSVDGIREVEVNIVFEPEWNKDMMSEEAKLELGFL